MASPNRGFFELLSVWLRSLLAELNPLSSGDAEIQGGEDQPPADPQERPRNPPPTEPERPSATGIDRVVPGGRITARFLSTGSPAWKNQWKKPPVYVTIGGVVINMAGKHGGLDISAPQGTPVYAPYGMSVIKIGHYDDVDSNGDHCCRYGTYIIGMLDDDPTVQYYSGHLQNVKLSGLGHVAAGTQLGETNEFNHTHLQFKRGGVIFDPETYLAAH